MLKHPSGRLLLLGALLLQLTGAAFADPFNEGVAAYKANNYAKAATLMQTALRQNPKNADAAFYLGTSLAKTNQYDAARQAFEMVIQMVPPSHELADKAKNNISWLTKQQITLASNSTKATQIMKTSLSKGSKDNYLTHVIPGGKVVHFSTAKMPLKVFIASGASVQGWNNGMRQVVLYAMQSWQSASKGKVTFTTTQNENNADIIVRWQRNFADNILGVSPFQTAGDTIIRSDISLAVFYPNSSTPIPLEELKGIAVHEMGHAIGIKGHSPDPNDIMFYAKARKSSAPSQRDINTIGMLYNLEADVQNNTSMSTIQTRQYYELVDLGVKAQTNNRATEAINYYRRAMQLNSALPQAKFNLGAVLINEGNKMWQLKNLSGAKRNFEEATRLYAELMKMPQPPKNTKENLEIAQNNLTIVNGSLNR